MLRSEVKKKNHIVLVSQRFSIFMNFLCISTLAVVDENIVDNLIRLEITEISIRRGKQTVSSLISMSRK